MTIGICCLLALLAAGPAGEMVVARAGMPELQEPALLISRNEAIADLDQVCVSLLAHGMPEAMPENLTARAAAKLQVAGMEHIECQTGVTPRLHIRVETISLAGCGRTVYRVQTALSRIVTFTDHRELRVQADVWRVKPVMEAVDDPNLVEAVTEAVLTQAEAFASACQAAKRLLGTSAARPAAVPPLAAGAGAAPTGRALLVASKSSAVFHRANCRWAQNIAAHNRVTYSTRAAAVADGKRPCKSCQP